MDATAIEEAKARDAAAAEADDDDGNEAADDDEREQAPSDQTPEPPADAPHAATDAEWEDRFKKAEGYFKTYQRNVLAKWGDDAAHLTPFNIDPGAPPGFIDTRNAGFVEEETKAAALAFLGFAREQDYEADPDTRECGTCKGKGKTSTGSHVPGRETRACPTCHGTGAEGLGQVVATGNANGPVGDTFTLAEPSTADAPDKDNWGEPRILPDGRENPNYGRQPQYKIMVEPWGVTTNLGVQDAA